MTDLNIRRPAPSGSLANLAATADAHASWLGALSKVLPATVVIGTPAEAASYVAWLQAERNKDKRLIEDLSRNLAKYKTSLKAAITIQSELIND